MTTYTIEKLNRNNYLSWTSDIKFVLIERGLWDIIIQKEVMPSVKVVSVLPEASKTQEAKSDASLLDGEIRIFKQRCNLALSILYLNIEPEFRKIVEDADDPVVAWKKLRACFCPDDRSFHMSTFSDLMNCRIEVNESISLFSARLRRIYNQLLSISSGFDEEYLCFQVLRYLPQKFDAVVQSILRWKKEDFVFDRIVQELVGEESRLKLKEKDSGDIQVLSVRGRTGPVKCYACGRLGHVRSQCRSREVRGFSSFRSNLPPHRPSRSSPPNWTSRSSPERFRRPGSSSPRSPDNRFRTPPASNRHQNYRPQSGPNRRIPNQDETLVKEYNYQEQSVYVSQVKFEDMSDTIDTKKYPPSLGITIELCAGIVDKCQSLVETARDEVIEECGYDVPLSSIQKVTTYRSGTGISGSNQTLFYVEVTDAMKVSEGGGNVDEGECIDVIEMDLTKAYDLMYDETIPRPGTLILALLWFFQHKMPHIANQKL